MNGSSKPTRAATSFARHLTLLASSFLVGVASGNWLVPRVAAAVFATGAVGLIAYLALYVVSNRRERRLRETAVRQTRSRLEQKLERHKRHSTPRPAADHRHRSTHAHAQYVPVATRTLRAGW